MNAEEPHDWVGHRVRRKEDLPLVKGEGTYIADVRLPRQPLEVAILRSPHAHARLRSIDVSEASAAEGVEAVFTGETLPDWVRPLPVLWKVPDQKPSSTLPLATGKVRYMGEPIAAVVATNRYLAEDALDLIEVDYEEIPAVVDVSVAADPQAPVINPDWKDNIAATFRFENGEPNTVIGDSEITIAAHFEINRHSGVPLEGRGIIANWDEWNETLTVWSGSQDPHVLRTQLGDSLGIPEHAIRVTTPNVGGAFGIKWDAYSEDLLIPALSCILDRPVRWIEDRSEHLQASAHSRQQSQDWEMGCTREGRIVGLRGRVIGDLGAHMRMSGIGPMLFTGGTMPNQYAFSNYHVDLLGVATNKTPNSTYRGFGMPEGNFPMERLMDKAARKIEMDPAEFRLRNLVPAEQLPFTNAAGLTYDSGDYEAVLRKALDVSKYDELRQEQAELRRNGIYRGIGISCFVEGSGIGPSRVMPLFGYDGLSGYEGAIVRIDPRGKISVHTSMIPSGQGTETTLAQVASQQFETDPASIRVVWGDTLVTPYSGFGSAGSRSNVAASAVMRAGEQVKSKALRIGADLLEAAPDDVEYRRGEIQVKGSPEQHVSLADVAREAYLAYRLSSDIQPTLEGTYVYDPPDFTWPYGCHIAVLDVDPKTGQLSWVRYIAVDDCGTIINPTLVEGQVHGGVTQAIGGAILEEFVYDENGQLLTTSLMDYLLPSFTDVPTFESHHLVTDSPHSEGGFKGSGESGCIPPAAAIANAVSDALAPFGVEIDKTPITPGSLWEALQASTHVAARA